MIARIDEWQRLGVIEADTADALRRHESEQSHPWLLRSIAGLGVLAMALGILLVVASNWDEIASWLKISVHLGLTIAAAVAVWVFDRRYAMWMTEAALFLFAALVLAGIALHSQIYQLVGPLWQALALWVLVVAPAILLFGRTRLSAHGFAVMLIALVIAYNVDAPTQLGQTLAAGLPAALVLAGLALPATERNRTFCDGLFDIGIRLTLIVAALVHIGWVSSVNATNAAETLSRLPLATVLTVAAVVLAARRRSRDEGVLIGVTMGGALLVGVLALGIAHDGGTVSDLIGLLSFLVFWSAVAVLADKAGWFGLFGSAIALLALRMFLIYFQLFYSLAFTGFGLMIAGVLLLLAAWSWTRVMRAKRVDRNAA